MGVSVSSDSNSASQTTLRHLNRPSPISAMQRLSGGKAGGRNQKSLVQSLQLTSLIDAFAIIVIYLLIGTQSGGVEGPVPHKIELPNAEFGTVLEEATLVRIEKGYYFIGEQPVSLRELGSKLFDLRRTAKNRDLAVLVQADTNMDYRDLDPLIRAFSEAGIQKVKFAVIPTGTNAKNL